MMTECTEIHLCRFSRVRSVRRRGRVDGRRGAVQEGERYASYAPDYFLNVVRTESRPQRPTRKIQWRDLDDGHH